MRQAILICIFLLISTQTFAGSIPLRWTDDKNTGHSGYYVYYGTTSHLDWERPTDPNSAAPYANRVQIADPNARGHNLDVPVGRYYIRVMAYQVVNGVEEYGPFSYEIGKEIKLSEVTNLQGD